MLRTYFFIQKGNLYCRFIDQNKKTKKLSTGIQLDKKDLNLKLQYSTKKEANDIIRHWMQVAETSSLENIKQSINLSQSSLRIRDVIKIYIDRKKLALNTSTKYIGFANIIDRYCPDLDVPVPMYSKSIINQIYSRFRDHMSINSAEKRMQQLNGFLLFALNDLEIIDKNPFRGLKFKREKKEIVFLNEEEIKKIKTKELSKSLSVIRDVFLFQIYTGFEYSRVRDLKPDDIRKGIDGNYWAYTKRKKTGKVANVILLDEAMELINKYKGVHPFRCFPVRSNAKSNEYLKDIQVLCDIDKSLHTHLARHTFATTICLLKGISYEVTAKMMGISVSRLVQNYGVIVDQRVSFEFSKANEGKIGNIKSSLG